MGSRPGEAVPFIDDDPRPIARQAEVAPDGVRHFDRQLIAGGEIGGQRDDVHLIDPILLTGHQNNSDGPVFYTFIVAFSRHVSIDMVAAYVRDYERFREHAGEEFL